MPRDYWGEFLKDSERIVRDANEVFKKNYETFVGNVEKEARRMKQRIDCLNRIKDLEVQLQNPTREAAVLDEKDRKFLEIMETIHRIVDSLQNINTICNPMLGDQPHVNPGAHEFDVTNLDSERQHIRNQIDAFRQLVATNNNGFAPQLTFLLQMDGIIQGIVLRTICLELQNVIDQGDSVKVKQYGSLAGSLLQQIDGLVHNLDWELRNIDGGSQVLPSEERGDNNETIF